jgi:hypothetical protein
MVRGSHFRLCDQLHHLQVLQVRPNSCLMPSASRFLGGTCSTSLQPCAACCFAVTPSFICRLLREAAVHGSYTSAGTHTSSNRVECGTKDKKTVKAWRGTHTCSDTWPPALAARRAPSMIEAWLSSSDSTTT